MQSQKLISSRSLILMAVLLAALALFPSVASRYYIYLVALMLVTGLLASSLNIVLGFGGMYQFNHAVFYGVGAYAAALLTVRGGVSPWWGYLAGPLAAAVLSLLMGIICVRLSKLYFGMLQISLGSLVWAVVFRWYSFTGGDDGMHGVPVPRLIGSGEGAYYFVLIVTVICLALMYLIVNSPFGRVFMSIRDNPERAEAIGVNVRLHQLIGLVIAGFFGGVAGTLFVTVEGTVFPDMLFWTLSLEIIIMCLLGGWFTFLGPMLGGAMVVALRSVVGTYTDYWTMVLGIILMLLIFFLPEGVLGFFTTRLGRGRAAREEN